MTIIITKAFPSFFSLLIFTAVLAGCSGDDNRPPSTSTVPYTYEKPQSDSDWETRHVSEVGLDSAALETMMSRQNLEALNIQSVLIVKDNALVFEEYFSGEDSTGVEIDFDKDTLHEQFSVTKSISSLLMGIAIENGAIGSLDESLSAYMPDHSAYFSDPLKASITLYDVLTMQGGIEWNELRASRETSALFDMLGSEDPLTYTLSQPSIVEPGTVFEYSTGVATLLSEVINTATASSVDVFAQENLFTRLNIDNASWQTHETGHIFTGTGLSLRPRDMAKIGQLILNNGVRGDEALISESWINESTSPHLVFQDVYPFFEYAYYWWRRAFYIDANTATTVIVAMGYGGQMIYVIPEFSAVVVFTAGNFDAGGGQVVHSIMEADIVPSFVSQ
ncbi:MAG: beta-lactamase family protein [Agarilytica sp.]